MIRLDHVSLKGQAPDRQQLDVLHDISLSIEAGESVGIVGEEGSGKTALLNVIGGLVQPSTGRVDHAPRGEIACTFQFPDEQFLATTVAGEFEETLRLRSVPTSEIEDRMNKALASMGLDPVTFGPRSPFWLSLGEARRVAAALALATEADALLLDEPTSGLDTGGISRLVSALTERSLRGTTLIVASHDMEFLAAVVRRIVVVRRGSIVADGQAGEVIPDFRF